MNIATLLARSARVFPDRPALAFGSALHCTYDELAGRVSAMACGFVNDFALAPGDRVALVMGNCPEYIEALYAVWHAGLIAVPINAKLHPREIEYIVGHSGARLCFVTPDLAEVREAAPDLHQVIITGSPDYAALSQRKERLPLEPRAPDDVAWLFYTSGTTGRPKGVMLTHRNLLMATLSFLADVETVLRDDCLLHAAPMSHGSGLYNFAYVLNAALQVIPASGHFDPAEIFELIGKYRGVSFFAAPTMVKRLVDFAKGEAPDVTNLKTVVYGGGPMYVADIQEALAVLGHRFAQIYGQGESPMTITVLAKFHLGDTTHPRHLARLASVGVAQSVVEVRVADENDQPLPTGETGEILVGGDVVMSGYWMNPEATAITLRGGWLHTGDLGSLDEDGFLTLKDRSKDLIISGGSNIYPREVEEVLLSHPAVSEVSVVGRPHPDWGEEAVAFVVRRADAMVGEEELDRLCLSNIARFKRPKQYYFVEQLPKNNYGKVLKTALREMLKDVEGC